MVNNECRYVTDIHSWDTIGKQIYNNVILPAFMHQETIAKEPVVGKYFKDNKINMCAVFDDIHNCVAACVYAYMPDTKAVYIIYIATIESCRRQGLANALYEYLSNKYFGCIIAVEIDVRDKADNHSDAKFWSRIGFHALPFEYIQPALTSFDTDVGGMLLALNMNGIIQKSLLQNLIIELYVRYYALTTTEAVHRVSQMLCNYDQQIFLKSISY